MRTLILGLGNDLLGDDAVGLLAARELSKRLCGRDNVDVIESSCHGVALLDHFIGYQRAIVLDSVQTGKYPPGTVISITPSGLKRSLAPSPHYCGLPEMFELADKLGIEFPQEVVIFAVEVKDPHTIGGRISEEVRGALPELVRRVEEVLGE